MDAVNSVVQEINGICRDVRAQLRRKGQYSKDS